jgi:hypothetical protein
MKCPVIARSSVEDELQECIQYECAWFNEYTQKCVVPEIQKDLRFLRLQVEDGAQ